MYDFTQAVNAAKQVVERSESSGEGGGREYTYPLVYPQKGHTIVVRPLFNPASGQIVRLVRRHEKTPCYKTYNIECPICKVMEQVKSMTGQDPFGRTKSSRTRGICFAQYISSTNQIDKGNNKGIIQPGEIILFMFPWSVYEQINMMIQAIAQSPTGMDQAFCHAQNGFFVQVNSSAEFKYTTTNVPYMTFPSRMTDDEFLKMLDTMESLNDQVIPAQITEEVSAQVKEYEDAIYRQYVAPQVPNVGVPQGTAPVNLNTANVPQAGGMPFDNVPPFNPPYTVAAPAVTPNGQYQFTPTPAPSQVPTGTNPVCFGNHKAGAPQCLVCPSELQCMENTK